MRNLIGLTVVIATSLPAGAMASNRCPANQDTIFACSTTNNKQVRVCDGGDTIGYTFGRPGQPPEMALRVPRQRTSTWQWPGMGYTATYSATIPNGKTRYVVWSTTERGSDPVQSSSGIAVEVNGKQVANILCLQDDTLLDNLFDIDLPREN